VILKCTVWWERHAFDQFITSNIVDYTDESRKYYKEKGETSNLTRED
jgi:hypothetical protein